MADFQTIDEIQTALLESIVSATGAKDATIDQLNSNFDNAFQIYGLTDNAMARKSTAPIVITGGSDAFGTELIVHDGKVIEAGASDKYFNLDLIAVSAIGTANRVTILEFYSNILGTAIADVTIDETGGTVEDMFSKVAHGLINGDKIIFTTITTTTGINAYTVYYVVNKSDDYFQISLTNGGSAVEISGDGSCTIKKVTATLLTECLVSNVVTIPVISQSELCNVVVSCRAKAAGGTNAISFFLGLHTYNA